MPLSTLLWSTPLRKYVTSITAGLGLVASLGAAIKASPVIEPYFPAWKGYVREIADNRVAEYKPTIDAILRYQAQDALSKVEAEIAQWNIKLPSEQDPQTKSMIQGRLRELDGQKARLETRIRTLNAP